MDYDIPYHRPSVGQKEIHEITSAIESRWIAGPGPYADKAEEMLESQYGAARVLTVSSCTHALEIALLSLDLNRSDEIIVPSFTYVSTALAVIRAGGTPAFADVDYESACLSVDTVREAITANTRGVILVHYGGYPAPTSEELQEFCMSEGLILVEDAAQTYDARLNQSLAGTFGRFGAISFHGTKSVTCGEGGALVINNSDDVESCEMIRDKGTDRSLRSKGDVDRYTWRSTGSSYVLSDILAAVLYAQLQKWPSIKNKRREIQSEIRSFLHEIDTESMFRVMLSPDNVTENGHITCVSMHNPSRRDDFLHAIQQMGIEAREHYHPLHKSPFARENLSTPDSLPNSERLANSLIRIPAHPELSETQIKKMKSGIVDAYREVFKSE